MGHIAVIILHTVTETDFGDRHSWQSPILTTAHDDETTIRQMTADVVTELASHGISTTMVEVTSRTPFPAEW